MLSENDRRILDAVFKIFVEDFDARAAATYMELLRVFTQDDSRQIEEQKSRVAALRDFYKLYSRKADNLDKIDDYLKYSKQPNLIDAMNKFRCYQDGPNDHTTFHRHLTKEERRRILIKGQVPFGRNLVNRSYDVGRLAESLRSKEEYNGGFFVVLHGLAGMGKTSLVTYTLAETDLIGRHFDHVCFLTAGGDDPKDVKAMFYDLMVMLQEDIVTPPPMDISDTALRKLILDAMVDHPNLLVVIDDITQMETIEWAERLCLRVLATTRDKSIFNIDSNSCIDFIDVEGFRYEETKELMAKNNINMQSGFSKTARAINLAHEVTSGNPALLLKMANLSEGCSSTLFKIANNIPHYGISLVDIVSSYRFKNLHSTLSNSVMRLSECDRNSLACIAVMPPDQWIPLEVWELVIPVDVVEMGDIQYEVRRQLRALHKNGGWITESADHEAFKVPAVVIHYLMETVEPEDIQARFAQLESAFATIQAANGYVDERQAALRDFFVSNSQIFTPHHYKGTPV